MEETLKQLGDNIRQLRQERNLSQHRLAIITQISESDLSRIENAKKGILLATLVRIAKGLCVPTWRLLSDCDTPKS